MNERYVSSHDERVYRSRRRYEKKRRQREILQKTVFAFFTLCLVIGLSISYQALITKASSPSDTIQYKYYKSVSVAYGETLWSLASENYTNGYESIYDYIYEVKEINHLSEDEAVLAGQALILPYYSSEFK